MVEKIIINPNKVRGYGNIMSPHSSSDYSLEDCTIEAGTDTVNGATETVYTLTPTASHSYSLSFGSASYTAVGGACTVTVTLTDNSTPVENATISVSGGTGGTGTGTTNSSGVATINVTSITASGTLTASFGGVTATASVTYSNIIYQSALTSDDGNWVASGGNRTVTYSSDGCNVTGTATSDGFYKLDETKVTIPHTNFVCEFDLVDMINGTYNWSTIFVVGNICVCRENNNFKIKDASNNFNDLYSGSIPTYPVHIRVEVDTTQCKMYVDDTLLGTCNLNYDYIGFRTYNGRSMTVKNVEIGAL